MTLTEAIDYCERIGNSRYSKGQAEHLQIAEYLKELEWIQGEEREGKQNGSKEKCRDGNNRTTEIQRS